ncbi:techylectin-5B-like, partial [Stegodyphus dumicola]|uniref:techylectin-5B-like n=1 Tax=Stegodyphus dumicola TaxID=202533 RepID=UPI0015A88EC2
VLQRRSDFDSAKDYFFRDWLKYKNGFGDLQKDFWIGDSFSMKDGMAFTTKDRDNDKDPKNCAVAYKGTWWYTGCHASNLNGYYLKGPHETHADGVNWRDFRGYKYSLKDTVIKIRPKDFR